MWRLVRSCWLALMLAVGVAVLPAALSVHGGAAIAQTADAPDYSAWQGFAEQAETAIANETTASVDLETLRAELVQWRAKFLTAQGANQARIDILQGQIDALGAAPAEGEPAEPEDIAARRKELNAQLATATAPRRAADEAYTRADGLIRTLDTELRERQADKLLELGPTPLNPALLPDAARAALGTGQALLAETTTKLQSPAQRETLRSNLPVVIFFLVIALVLLVRGRAWMEQVTAQVETRLARWSNAQEIGSVVTSVGQLVLPVAGLLALGAALRTSGLLGERGDIIAGGLVATGLAAFGARWVAGQVFPREVGARAPLFALSIEKLREARTYSALMGLLLGLQVIILALFDKDEYSEAARAVWQFPAIVLAGLMLFRMGQLMRSAVAVHSGDEDDPAEHPLRNSVIGGLGRAAVIIGIGAPVLAAIGYRTAAAALLWPALSTLALLGLLTILSRLFVAIYGALTRKTDEDLNAALVPVLLNFMLVLLSLPLFALLWGARTADLSEMWTRFRTGLTIGEVTISPTSFVTFAIIFAIGYLVTRLVQKALTATVLPKTKMDIGGQNAVRAGVGYLGIFLAAVIAITSAGIDLSSLAIVAGALSVGIGFGLQTIVSNFVSGIILLIERPISEGDWIKVGDQMGFVRDISVRSTRIETFDRTDVIVPNADLISGTVTNYTRGNSVGRVILPVGVAYGTDTRRVEELLKEIANANPLVSLNPPPQVLFMGFGADSLDFEIRAILPNVTQILVVTTEINHEINRRFNEEGIEIPFAQRDVWLRNPEVLRPDHTPAPKPESAPEQAAFEATPAASAPAPAAAQQLDASDMPDADGDR